MKTSANDFSPGISRRNLMRSTAALAAISSFSQVSSAMSSSPQESSAAATSTAGRYLSIDGNRVYIEERGSGTPIFMAAGGQNLVETLRPLATKLAEKYRVITWDRANLGRADVVIKGARDLDLWSDQLSGMIRELDTGPAYLIGASSAARVAYTTALRYPDHTRGLLTYLTTGGGTISERLAERYYYAYASIAEEGGMEAIIENEFWADRVARNPDNGKRLLSMDPAEFAKTMRRWGSNMRSSDVMIGIKPDECQQIKANGTPTAIVQGCPEATAHRRDRSELFAELTGATLISTPEGYCEEETTGPRYDELITRPEVPESPPFRAYEMISMMPQVIDEFIQATEAQYSQRGLGKEAFSLSAENEDA